MFAAPSTISPAGRRNKELYEEYGVYKYDVSYEASFATTPANSETL